MLNAYNKTQERCFRELDDHTIALNSMLSIISSSEEHDGETCFFWSENVVVLIGLSITFWL